MGSPLYEVLGLHKEAIAECKILEKLKLKSREFFLVSAHRQENVDDPKRLTELITALNEVAKKFQVPIIVSTHPRTKSKLGTLEVAVDPLLNFHDPFGFFDYNKLQMEAFCVVSDSGTITEEGSLLNLPAITIRNAHERPEGMDVGTLIMSGLKPQDVLDAVHVVTDGHHKGIRVLPAVADYEAGAVSKKVLRIVMSYIDYINRTVWHKN
jgi:UDP-N-acetylglucosamine 2-epimerase (non-hydrolysing)